jgi:hypothetical protein
MDGIQRSFADVGNGAGGRRLNRRQNPDLNQRQSLACWDGVTDYRIMRFFGRSNYGFNARALTTEDAAAEITSIVS